MRETPVRESDPPQSREAATAVTPVDLPDPSPLHVLTQRRIYIPVTIMLLVGVAWFTFGRNDAGAHLSGDTIPLLLAATLVNLLAIPLWALRTQLVLKHLGHSAPLQSLALLTTFANVGNQILPAAGGEVARGAYLSKLHDVPGTTTAAALVFERLLGFLLMAATAFGAVLALRFGVASGIAAGIAAVGLAGALIYLLGLRRNGNRTAKQARGGRLQRSLAALAGTSAGVRSLAGAPGLLVGFALLSTCIYAVLTAGFMLSSQALGVGLNPVEAWALHGAGMTIGTLSAIPFGLGAAEAAMAAIGAWAGISVANSLVIAAGMRLALTLPLGVLGAISYSVLSRRLRGRLDVAVTAPPTPVRR